MSKRTEAEMRGTICDKGDCWAEGTLTDAQVTANLKGSWHILALDRHFQGCAKRRLGNIADGVAVYPNENNNRLRVLELKPKVDDYPDAAKKFRKTLGVLRQRLPHGFHGLRVDLELHVKAMPVQTAKLRKVVENEGTQYGVRAYRDGEQV
jgi:hypothetical protein